MADYALMALLSGEVPRTTQDYLITTLAEQPAHMAADYAALRHHVFVDSQALFAHSDRDDADTYPTTTVLVATDADGRLLGGVRLAPVTDPDLGWWTGSRLVLSPEARGTGVGRALVRAACAWVDANHVLRFEATIQRRYQPMFSALGWTLLGHTEFGGAPHSRMRWPIDRFERQANSTKAILGDLLRPLAQQQRGLGPAGFRGDDGVPVGDTGMIAACDAIIPSMVARDPEWAGWCSVLVNLNDLAAMGATATGLLDAVGAPTASQVTRIIRGLAAAAAAWGVPVLGGHTQVGVPAALSVTALGHTTDPVPGGGAKPGDAVTLTADLSGGWRPGYTGQQWDSTSRRESGDLRHLAGIVAHTRPHAAKDVSMAGLVGTVGMMAEASGLAAEITVADVPRPTAAGTGEWFSCFPGFAMITADRPGRPVTDPGPATSHTCGALSHRAAHTPLVTLRWPDGETTSAIAGTVTGLAPTTHHAICGASAALNAAETPQITTNEQDIS
ncbi:GNAT family N-acetyltransferase [soil metagenome]